MRTQQNCKSPTQRQTFITTIKSVTEYTHIYINQQEKSKHSNKNKVQYIDPANKQNHNYIYKNKTKAQTGI